MTLRVLWWREHLLTCGRQTWAGFATALFVTGSLDQVNWIAESVACERHRSSISRRSTGQQLNILCGAQAIVRIRAKALSAWKLVLPTVVFHMAKRGAARADACDRKRFRAAFANIIEAGGLVWLSNALFRVCVPIC